MAALLVLGASLLSGACPPAEPPGDDDSSPSPEPTPTLAPTPLPAFDWAVWSGARIFDINPAGWMLGDGCFVCQGRFRMNGFETTQSRAAQCPGCDYIWDLTAVHESADLDCLDQWPGVGSVCFSNGLCGGPCISLSSQDTAERAYGMVLRTDSSFSLYRTGGSIDGPMTWFGEGRVVDADSGQIEWRGGDFAVSSQACSVYVSGTATLQSN
jgi:hypothetical protein